MTLTFDLLTLKVVSQSSVTWATSVPILVFLCLSVLDLGPVYATDRQTDIQTDSQRDRCQTDVRQMSDVRQHHRLMPPPIRGGCIKMLLQNQQIADFVCYNSNQSLFTL